MRGAEPNVTDGMRGCEGDQPRVSSGPAGERVGYPSLANVALAASMLASAVLILWLVRGQEFFYDEWDLVLGRRAWSLDALLEPHNEHLFAVPIASLKLVQEMVGFAPHWPFVLPLLVAHISAAGLLYVLVSRRLGAWAGLGVAVLVLFLGSAWEDLLLPIQVSFVGSVAAGLATLVLLDDPPTRRRDALVAVLLLLSLACSSVGLSFVAVAFVEVVVRQDHRRRVWIFAAPAALYAAWFLAYGDTSLEAGGSPRSNLPLVPSFVADSAAGAAGALAGLGLEWGRLLAVGGLAVVVHRVLRAGAATTRLVSLSVGLASFWVLAGIARAHLGDPAATRYLYVGGVFVLLIGAEILPRTRPSRTAAVLLSLALAFAVVANLNLLRGGRDTLDTWSAEISARLFALEIVGPELAQPDFQPAPELAPRLRAGEYFDAIVELGSPAASWEELASSGNEDRKAADDVLVRGFALRARPGARTSPAPPSVDVVRGGIMQTRGGCVHLRPTQSVGHVEVTVAAQGVVLRSGSSSADLAVRRFADDFSEPLFAIGKRSTVTVRLPRRGSDHSWHARASSEGAIELCSMHSSAGRR